MEQEIWKEVVGYEKLYHVSSLGKIKSVRIIKIRGNLSEERPIVLSFRAKYLFMTLCKNNTKTGKNVHRIVAESFLPNPENKPCINHKNGIKTDNRVDNLEWATYKENSRHAFATGLNTVRRGEEAYRHGWINERHVYSKETFQYDLNMNLIKKYPSSREASRQLNCCYKAISAVCTGRRDSYMGFKWRTGGNSYIKPDKKPKTPKSGN